MQIFAESDTRNLYLSAGIKVKIFKSQMISDVLEKSDKQAHMAGQQYDYNLNI